MCVVTSHLVLLHKGGCKRWVSFSFQFCPGVRRWSHQNRSHPFGGANRGRGLPAPTYLTFCHFRIDFSSFTPPRFFASPLFLDFESFAEITFAFSMNEVWELALIAELMKSGK